MPNKRLEAWYLDQLRVALHDFPSGTIEPGESPDFVVKSEQGLIGIEVTVFHLGPSEGRCSHQEQQSLKDAVVGLANRLHNETGGPALYVSVFFHEPIAFNKRNTQQVAGALVRAIGRTALPSSLNEGSTSVAWYVLPPGVVSITIRASVNGRDQLWSADAGGWVAPVERTARVRDDDESERQLGGRKRPTGATGRKGGRHRGRWRGGRRSNRPRRHIRLRPSMVATKPSLNGGRDPTGCSVNLHRTPGTARAQAGTSARAERCSRH